MFSHPFSPQMSWQKVDRKYRKTTTITTTIVVLVIDSVGKQLDGKIDVMFERVFKLEGCLFEIRGGADWINSDGKLSNGLWLWTVGAPFKSGKGQLKSKQSKIKERMLLSTRLLRYPTAIEEGTGAGGGSTRVK